jgi:2-isopropylmalate synthase
MVPGVQFSTTQKIDFAIQLEQMGVDVIEAGYPGRFPKDFEDLACLAQQVKSSILCGLAASIPAEIEAVAQALRQAPRKRIHLFTAVRFPQSPQAVDSVLAQIQASIQLARHYTDDVQWSAFDATRADPEVLCWAVEEAIASGATTINLPDSLGVASPTVFSDCLRTVIQRVPNLDHAVLSVHCHDDLGHALTNTLAAIELGVRQVECSVRGLGARRGNTDLGALLRAIAPQIPTLRPLLQSRLAEDILKIEALLTAMLAAAPPV